jgi:tRNA threonylcarbamoyladenosine biosynthesis protein TsaE
LTDRSRAPGAQEWESGSPEDTAELAGALAGLLGPGDVVTLRGDLGTGKTTLTRALARALGIADRVTSPTFALAQRYDGAVPLVHLDLYRLTGADAEELGLLFDDASDAVTVVEWPEQVGGGIPTPRIAITLSHAGGDRRLVALMGADAATRSRLADILADLRSRHLDSEP